MLKQILFVVVAALTVALVACGGGGGAEEQPVTFGQLPMFSGATESTNEMLVGLLNPMMEGLKAESSIASVEGKAYDVPAGTTWDAIKTSYSSALEKNGWTATESGDGVQAWSRGKQVLVLKYADGVGLIVVLSATK